MHVAAYIHDLSFARYNNSVKLPAEYLNSELVNMEKQQSPKKNTYFRNKRHS